MAIITGGAQGIGEATTWRLANEGAMTAILDIQLEKAQAVAEEILSQGGKKSIAVENPGTVTKINHENQTRY